MKPVAIVTGGSNNIGWACVRRLATDYRVLIADLRAPEAALPPDARFVQTNVADEQACAALLREADEAGDLGALVHSAAVTVPARLIEQTSLEEWRRVIEINLTGTFIVARSAIASLRKSRGSMVLIASRAARTGYAALVPTAAGTKAHYCASKAGVISLARSLAMELAIDGVRVNAVLPGSIEGTMIPRERWPDLAARIPMGRLGLPEEVAEAVAFLCSPGAHYITGHALDVNGGTWMS